MIFFGVNHPVRNSRQEGILAQDRATPLPPVSRPNHCGEDMQLTMQSAAETKPSPSPGLNAPEPDLHLVWQCLCGFRRDPHPAPQEERPAVPASPAKENVDHARHRLHGMFLPSAQGTTVQPFAESAPITR